MAAATTLDAALLKMRGQIAGNTSKAKHDPAIAARIADIRRDFIAAKLERDIRSALTGELPLTAEQRIELAALLAPAGGAQ